MRAKSALLSCLVALPLAGCAASDGAHPTALADGTVGYAVRAHLQPWEAGGVSDEAIVRKFVSYQNTCPGEFDVVSMRRVPDMGWGDRPWVDAVIRCRG